MLSRRGKTGVSPKPGFTKGKQWIKITKNLLLSDTPGVLDLRDAGKLWRRVMFPAEDIEGAALFLLEKIRQAEGNNFEELYKMELEENSEHTLEKLATKFNFIGKGGKPDIMRAAKRLIDDWNDGKLVAWWL